jgi:hypothetical protein
MTSRDVFILALRVLGVWAFLSALGVLTSALHSTYILEEMSRRGDGLGTDVSFPRLVVTIWAGPTVNCIAACLLLLCAPRIATIFYGRMKSGQDEPLSISLRATEAYQIATRILGIVALLMAVSSVARAIAAVREVHGMRNLNQHEIASFFEVVIYALCAAFLICGARRIADWLGKLRYDPNSAQQSTAAGCGCAASPGDAGPENR